MIIRRIDKLTLTIAASNGANDCILEGLFGLESIVESRHTAAVIQIEFTVSVLNQEIIITALEIS